VAVFAFAPRGHADLLNKCISLSRSAVRWEIKKEGKRDEIVTFQLELKNPPLTSNSALFPFPMNLRGWGCSMGQSIQVGSSENGPFEIARRRSCQPEWTGYWQGPF